MTDFEDYDEDYEDEPKRSRLLHPISLLFLAMALFTLGSLLFGSQRTG